MSSLDKNLNAANRRFSFKSAGFSDAEFSVVNMTGFEAISKNFRFELTLASDSMDIDFDKMLSNPASFSIFASGGGMETPYRGVLSEFEQLQQAGTLAFYRAVLVPRLERMALYRTSDVFLNDQTIPQILKTVIESSGLTSGDFEFKTRGQYRARDFVCQFQETNLDFLSRWSEKEGIYAYFDHSGTAEKMVAVDDAILQPAPVTIVSYQPIELMLPGYAARSVQSFTCSQKPLPKRVILQGFNYLKASVPLIAEAAVAASGTGDVMLYGENFLDIAEGQRYAGLRAQEIICGGKVFIGDATAVGLRSGYFMQMAGHYRDGFNGKYLVTQVEHRGSQAGVLLAGLSNAFGGKPGETNYDNTFRAIPATVQFRPNRGISRPHIGNTISAVIDAEGSGDYAEMDNLGRYKVQMPFIKAGKTPNQGSARIRMATPYSGSNHGINFPLHKGAEVLLSFVDGDPDQPVIVSAVPNSENLSIVNNGNPAQSLIRTSGGNQILMDDTKGKEVVYITSPYKNSALVIGNGEGKTSTVGRDGKDGKDGAAGAAGAKGDTGAAGADGAAGAAGAAGAKGDTGATGAAGAEPPEKEYPGIWASTGGSSEGITVGTSNAIKVGYSNSIGLGFDNSISGSMGNSLSVGGHASFSYGRDVSWKKGRSIGIDDSKNLSLSYDGNLKGYRRVLISGGQPAPLAEPTAKAKAIVQKALMLSIGLNLAAAAGAGFAISYGTKPKDGHVGVRDMSAGNWAARVLGLAGGFTSATLVNRAISKMATLMAEYSDVAMAYTSNIRVDGHGIDLSATTVTQGRIFASPERVTIQAGAPVPPQLPDVEGIEPPYIPAPPPGTLGSSIEVLPAAIHLTTPLATLPSTLDLVPAGATLATLNPASSVKMTHPTGGNATLAATGLTATSGAAKLELKVVGGATLTGSPAVVLNLTPAQLKADVSGSKLSMGPSGCQLSSPGASLYVTPLKVAVSGTLIQLG